MDKPSAIDLPRYERAWIYSAALGAACPLFAWQRESLAAVLARWHDHTSPGFRARVRAPGAVPAVRAQDRAEAAQWAASGLLWAFFPYRLGANELSGDEARRIEEETAEFF